ncbi:hypothetical protein IEQ34_009687 [Dendrobium chrysotoxum]|uniref:Ubiquitin-like protease family profile domain-containing protein n=1 Tax=Dendrobium chrysotoxum TaxID=161865 RepID=A0AAV7H1C2_DENCH|nr:hypothetical protein IEQ34_009687 [Dendrobium chrysotoxum]
MIFSTGNIVSFRSQIDELLTDKYLDNNHIDAFVILLAEKNQLCLVVSLVHWVCLVAGPNSQWCANPENSFDCGIFVCKYIEAVIQHQAVKWTEHKD